MALDFDVDSGPSFQDHVQSGRDSVLKGRTVSQCWHDLEDQHPFFKDIAKEGRLRGESLGVALAAIEGISCAIKRTNLASAFEDATVEERATAPTSSSAPPPAAAAADSELHYAEVLARVVDAYLRLCGSTPVPTRAQWLHYLQAALAGVAPIDAEDGNRPASGFSPTSTHAPSLTLSSSMSTIGRYLGKLQTTLQTVAQELANSNNSTRCAECEDGSFAEKELKELMRCCIASGRQAARHTALSKTEGGAVRKMVKTLQDYEGSSTLEW
ncbi:hypothetical protein ABL78_5680 [Leptomonas seymouri]|uniref:Uncharacterized protein n=1 Tax=Leptomonas seymouri TaxID=5684 RepID=A0A0N1I1X1_LEPSE|nr:hypothetical protein ABL78_5680 [Leptomonas seymouri]|eukprot:KPI85263.1 hypothetical protein ABL78_5680 [Leptomonas seymouri]